VPLLEAGGSGYVLKAGADTELIEAIARSIAARSSVTQRRQLLVDGYLDRSTREDEPLRRPHRT